MIDATASKTNQTRLFYRLKIIEADRTPANYSKIITLELPNNANQIRVVLQPHPVRTYAQFTFEHLPPASVLEITDLNGRLLYQQPIAAGQAQYDLGTLAAGMYLYRLRSQGKLLLTKKLVLVH